VEISRWRLGVVGAVLALAALGIAVRLAEIQIVQHDGFVRVAEDEHGTKQTVLPQRGTIRDRNGHPLVMSVSTNSILMDRAAFATDTKYEEAVHLLADTIQWPAEQIFRKVPPDAKQPVEIATGLSPEIGMELQNRGLPGVIIRRDSRRTYPEGSLAAQLIGFLGRDQAGLTGVEATYNAELTGRPGTMVYERDTRGDVIPVGARQVVAAEAGADLTLTIDRYLQRMVEQELDAEVRAHGASGGSIIVMDPKTGEILALASRPAFDLTHFDLSDAGKMALYRNRAVTDMYEPGSTFKIVTTSSALEDGKITPNSTFYDSGQVTKGGLTINNWDFQGHGTIDITQFLIHSVNVGAVWISDQLGAERFYYYVRRFGFGEPTHIDLDGEAPGILRVPGDPAWSSVDLATNSFGQGLTATPLQVITAVAAVANGGVLMQPYVVKGDPDPARGAQAGAGRGPPGGVREDQPADGGHAQRGGRARGDDLRGRAGLPHGREERHGHHRHQRRLQRRPDQRLVHRLRPDRRPAHRGPGEDRPAEGLALGERGGGPDLQQDLPGSAPIPARPAFRDESLDDVRIITRGWCR
jgi:cell division protein FtsI/penicillin-binding protein 2